MTRSVSRQIDLVGSSRLADSYSGIKAFDHSRMGIGRVSVPSSFTGKLASGAFASVLDSPKIAALADTLLPAFKTSGALDSFYRSRTGIGLLGSAIDQGATLDRLSTGGAFDGLLGHRKSPLEQFFPRGLLSDFTSQWTAKSNLLGPRDSTANLATNAGLISSLSSAGLLGDQAFDHSRMGIGRVSVPSSFTGKLASGAFASVLDSPKIAALADTLLPAFKTSGALDSFYRSRTGIGLLGSAIDQGATLDRLSTGGAFDGLLGHRKSPLEQFFPRGLLSDATRSWIERIQRAPLTLVRLQRVERELAENDPACARLAVLLRHVGAGRAVATMEQMLSEGFRALVSPLGEVLLDSEALVRFDTVIRDAELPPHVKNDLLHALEHLAEESSDHALPPLLTGLEGAFRHAVHVKGDRKSRSNARSLVAALGMERDHALLVGAIYDHANDARHGAELDRHTACVLALVGLVLWMNECLEQPAIDWLGTRLDEQLSGPHELVA